MSDSKIAVLIHLFYTDMWEDICGYLDNLNDYNYDLYINLINGHYNPDIINKINDYKKSEIIISKNIGVDIGGFLNLYDNLKKDYDLILKIHSKKSLGLPNKPSDYVNVYGYENAKKKGNEWFHRLMRGVLKSKEQVKDIIELLSNDTPFGMCGLDTESYVGPNIPQTHKLSEMFSIPVSFNGVKIENSRFVGGTIFWVRNDILKKYLTKDKINELLKILPEGYQNEPSYNHASERLFGMMVYNEKKKIIVL